jgi:DeoR/GlpR family transcriptional regulator of sugar metabolism
MSQTCDFDDIDIIITDKMPEQKYIDIFKESNCHLIVA